MWIREASPEQLAELFHSYERALGICGKGSESGSLHESARPEENPKAPGADSGRESAKSHHYFSQPGEAEWGC
jgi:hypothetical protein